MKDLSEKLKALPTSSGVYIMLDEYQQILYVGKAKNLKNRVRQYFQHSVKTEKTMQLVEKICDFRYIITNSEVEALVLENNLIKEHKPFYNILLKDDKSYPYIKINLKEKFPRIEIVRRLRADGSKYFGPYMLGLSPKLILELIHSVYPIRSCRGEIPVSKRNKRACLNFHLGNCLAPCEGKVSSEDYKAVVKRVIDFLNGNDTEVKALLTEKLKSAAADEEFELAINYRDKLEIMDKIVRKQIVNLPKDVNIDIFTYATNGLYAVINYMVLRGGKVLGVENHPVNVAGDAGEALSGYIMQFYDNNPVLCDEILVSDELEFANELKDYLSEKRGSKINLFVPRGGIRGQLTELSASNASDNLAVTATKIAGKEALTLGAVNELQKVLSLPRPPKRIECYDISNISGTDKVASMVVTINGNAARSMYRRFRIKTVKGQDDFACMREVLTRRRNELSGTDPSFSERPDLIIVDGGKGQLSSACEIMEDTGIPLAGLAKREEEIFRPHLSEPVILSRDSLSLKLFQRIRDEAHRFAITYHRALRKDRQTRSNLKNIEGVGDGNARALLTYFKKIENIATASVEELMEVEGIGRSRAEAIYAYYHNGENDAL